MSRETEPSKSYSKRVNTGLTLTTTELEEAVSIATAVFDGDLKIGKRRKEKRFYKEHAKGMIQTMSSILLARKGFYALPEHSTGLNNGRFEHNRGLDYSPTKAEDLRFLYLGSKAKLLRMEMDTPLAGAQHEAVRQEQISVLRALHISIYEAELHQYK